MSQTTASHSSAGGAIAKVAFGLRHEGEALAARLPALMAGSPHIATSIAQGVHGRRRVGTGEAFWQFRQYEAGDPVNRIDWRQSARGDRVFIRETEWEAAQSVWLWHDRSGSMRWSSGGHLPQKQARAQLLVMALASLLVRGGERVALMEAAEPPGIGKPVLDRIAMRLAEADTRSIADHADHGLTSDTPPPRLLPRHSMAVLVSDFLTPLSQISDCVGRFARRGVRGHLLQILDPAEELLPGAGRVEYQGLEGEGAELVPRVNAVRQAYREKLQAQKAGLEAIARTAGWSHAHHRTDEPAQAALLSLWGAVAGQTGGYGGGGRC